MKRANIIICFFLFFCLAACGDGSDSRNQVTAMQKEVPPSAESSPAEKALEWPFAGAQSRDGGVISGNLTTKNYILVFDGSGSMGNTNCGAGRRKIDVAKEAVMEWARTVPKDANVGVVAFFHDTWAELKLTSGRQDQFDRTIREIRASGSTPLTEALSRSYDLLTEQGRTQLGYGEYTIVVVTDGVANNEEALSDNVQRILDISPVNIYTIGFCIGENHSLNQPGQTVYKSADNPDELKKELSEVLAETEHFDDAQFN